MGPPLLCIVYIRVVKTEKPKLSAHSSDLLCRDHRVFWGSDSGLEAAFQDLGFRVEGLGLGFQGIRGSCRISDRLPAIGRVVPSR